RTRDGSWIPSERLAGDRRDRRWGGDAVPARMAGLPLFTAPRRSSRGGSAGAAGSCHFRSAGDRYAAGAADPVSATTATTATTAPAATASSTSIIRLFSPAITFAAGRRGSETCGARYRVPAQT